MCVCSAYLFAWMAQTVNVGIHSSACMYVCVDSITIIVSNLKLQLSSVRCTSSVADAVQLQNRTVYYGSWHQCVERSLIQIFSVKSACAAETAALFLDDPASRRSQV